MIIEKTPQDYFRLFHGWAEARGIYKNSTALAQSLKGNSESGEMCDAVIKGDRDGVLDGIGDTCVCLYNTAVLAGVSERITVSASVPLVDDVRVIAATTHLAVADASFEVAAIHSFQPTHDFLDKAKADLSRAINNAMRGLRSLAEMHDSTITECMALAWEEIKDRAGFLNSDGRTGITLRDQFAMQAMKAFLTDEHGHPTLESVAEYAYKMADVMLKEREK